MNQVQIFVLINLLKGFACFPLAIAMKQPEFMQIFAASNFVDIPPEPYEFFLLSTKE